MSAAAICESNPKIRGSLVYLCGEGVYHNLFTLAAPVALLTSGWTSMCADVPVPAPCFRAFLRYGNLFFSNEAKTFNFQKGGLDAECAAVEHLPTLIGDCLQISDVYARRSCIWGAANFAFDHPKCVKASSLGMCAQTKSLTMICVGAVYWRPIFSVREVNEPEYASPTWPSRCEGLVTTWGGEPYNWCACTERRRSWRRPLRARAQSYVDCTQGERAKGERASVVSHSPLSVPQVSARLASWYDAGRQSGARF